MSKKINQDQLYQNTIDAGENSGGLSGIRSSSSGDPIEMIGSVGDFRRSQNIMTNWNAANRGVSNIQDIYGNTDYGNSIYDEQIVNASQLENLEDTRANIQPFIDKFAAGVGTFAAKTALQTAGAYTMMTYGVGKMISSGEFNQLYNNDAMKALDQASEAVDDTFKVYMKEADLNGSLFDRTIGSQHFWTKSFLGDMMSFVASAALSGGMAGAAMKGLKIGAGLAKLTAIGAEGAEIASESLIGGTKAAKTIADVSNGLKLLSGSAKGADVTIGALRKAVGIEKIFNPIGKLSSGLIKNTLGAGYEAATEANGLIKEATQKYNTDFYNQNGRLPDDNELVDFHKKILDQSNGLFIGNLALLTASQVSTLPTIFGKGVNETISSARKGITSELVEGAEKLVTKSSQRNALGKAFNVAKLTAKPLVMEGLVEEGGQNFGKNLAMDYIDKHYNPDSAKNIYDITKSLGDAFNQSYMTIDGWQDIISGMIVGGLGAPHIGNMGRFEEKEDGTKVWNKFGNLKDRKLLNFKDAQNSWWTGGIVGQFQEAHENDLRAKELIDDYEKQKLSDAQEDFKNKLSKKLTNQEGIVSQIGDINHQNSASTEYDDAIKNGDHFTAKNSEEDKFHLYVKSRVDAGYHSTLRSELIDPIRNLTPEEFGESFGYENMTKEELQDRQNETIKQAEKSIKSTVDAIKFVDSNRTFNLGTEEGRLNRNMLIYSIATNKSVGDRIDKLNKTVADNLKDRITPTIDTTDLDSIIAATENLIKLDEDLIQKAKDANTEDELKLIPTYESRIESNRKKLEESQLEKLRLNELHEARKKIYSGEEKAQSVEDVRNLLDAVQRNYKKVDESPEEEQRYNDTVQSLNDLIKLYRRKEEALELYAITKDPNSWANFYKTERVSKRIENHINSAGEKITESQNAEHEEAKEQVKAGEAPEVAASKTGAPITSVHKFLNNELRKKALKLINKEDAFLKVINSGNEHQFESIEDFEEAIDDILNDPESAPEELSAAQQYSDALDKLHEDVEQPEEIEEPVDAKDLLSDENSPNPTDEITTTNEINTRTTKDLTRAERKADRIREGDKIVDAYNHIAWKSEENDNAQINKAASKITQDFEKLNVGDKLTFEVKSDLGVRRSEIESRRLEDKERRRSGMVLAIESRMPNNPNHKVFKVGQKFNEGMRVIVADGGTNETTKPGGIEVISRILEPAEFGPDGKMTKAAKIQVSIFDDIESANEFLLNEYNSIKEKVIKKEANIDAKYDAELAELNKSQDVGSVPIAIKKDGEIIGWVHDVTYMTSDKISGDIQENIEGIMNLRNHIINNPNFTSEVEYRGNGKLIGRKSKDGKINSEQKPTTEAFPDSKVVITAATNGKLDLSGLNAGNSEVINEQSIADGTKSTIFMNAPYALLPVNKNTEGKIQYIAVPLSPQTIGKSNPEIAKTLSTIIKLHAKQKLSASNSDFDMDRVAESIKKNIQLPDGKISDPRTINGLKNLISMFTYNHTSLNDTLNLNRGKSNNFAIGVNEMRDGSFVVSFGLPGSLKIYKFDNKGLMTENVGNRFDLVQDIEQGLKDMETSLVNHFNGQLFYHNKSLLGTTIQIPTTFEVDGKVEVKYESKPYSDLIKQSTRTNLSSYNIGTEEKPHYIYTVQANIGFKQPKIEEKKVEVDEEFKGGTEEFKFDTGPTKEEVVKTTTRPKRQRIEGARPVSTGFNPNEVVLSPSFESNIISEYSSVLEEKDDLGKSFIEFANEQPKEVRQGLKRMLQNKMIETKCN